MKFIKDFYNKISYVDEISIVIAISNIQDMTIHGFGKKNENTHYLNPYDNGHLHKMPTGKQKNFRFEKNIIVSEMGDKEIDDLVKEVDTRVCNALGETIVKCFDDKGVFDKNQLVGFRNVRSR